MGIHCVCSECGNEEKKYLSCGCQEKLDNKLRQIRRNSVLTQHYYRDYGTEVDLFELRRDSETDECIFMQVMLASYWDEAYEYAMYKLIDKDEFNAVVNDPQSHRLPLDAVIPIVERENNRDGKKLNAKAVEYLRQLTAPRVVDSATLDAVVATVTSASDDAVWKRIKIVPFVSKWSNQPMLDVD